MKNSTAYKQSKSSVQFLAVTVPCVWGMFFWTRIWQFAALGAFMSLYLMVDALSVIRMRKAAKQDPDFLKKKVPGT